MQLLPLNLYQIQVKYRDERRPRFGVMRTRSFTMKDAYSFDIDEAGLDKSYNDMFDAYTNIFARCGLENSPVQADTGAIGGSVSAEFMVKSEVGEDDIAFCTACDYAANMEKAKTTPEKAEKVDMLEIEKIATPTEKTIEEVSASLNVSTKDVVKTIILKADENTVAVLVRGDREVNETKVANAIGGALEIQMASDSLVRTVTSAEPGFAGPVGIKVDKLLVDEEVANMYNFVVGANETGYHLKNINYGRDFEGTVGDFRNVVEGEKCPVCDNGVLTIARGTEVGHIFKLGTKYSEAMGANFIDENGKAKPFLMGCYGIGVTRTLASIIEQHNDENGIVWPMEVAPYQIVVVPVNAKNEEQMTAATEMYEKLKKMRFDVLLDDRNERAGVKFKDAELLGIPMRITVGRGITEGEVEFKLRTAAEAEVVKLDEIYTKINDEFNK